MPDFLRSIIKKILRTFEKRAYLVFVYESSSPLKSLSPISGTHLKKITTTEDLHQTFTSEYIDADKNLAKKDAENLIKRGCYLYLTMCGTDVLGYIFMENKQRTIMNHTINLDSHEGFLFKGYTEKNHRGKGVYTYLLNEILNTSVKDKSKIWIDCRTTNKPSINGIINAGFTYTETITSIFIFSVLAWSSKRNSR